ncbi:hypothetical protein ABRP17_010450 [Stenotrophomonas sp. WHRI 8082]|uniref:hypothetical protein n=1 Tax=Stenotrophomonas sp. WHRI 8082 TaxID=3162571 RepID=UPI0032EB8582
MIANTGMTSMENDALQKITGRLAEAARDIDAADCKEDAKAVLVGLAFHLQTVIARMENESAAEGPWSIEHALHERSITNYDRMQKYLSAVGTALANEGRFVWMLRNKDNELEALKARMRLVTSMDLALQHLIDLMQFDATERVPIDIRQGFQFSSGSMSYGRMYFQPSSPDD